MKIGIVTLGCDKNRVDTEYTAGLLAGQGVAVEPAGQEPDDEDFDAVLINTCAFVDIAKQESIRAIVDWVDYKQELRNAGRRLRVFVAGCLSQRYREELVRELPEVDGFVGVGEYDKVVQLILAPEGTSSSVNQVKELPTVEVDREIPRLALGGYSAHAFLKIADGCNHNCAFCAIPSFKGRLRSVPKEILLAEARLLVSRGVREMNIVAQDTSDYGKDLYGRDYGIADLLAEIAAIPGDFWIRIFYFYPGGLTPRFLEMMAATPKIARYIDMPLQHLHPETLRRMKRPHNTVNTFDAVARLRSAVPGVALRTTFIVGFPGETADEFQFLLEGVPQLQFRRMGAFTYSQEEGTPAAAMTPEVPKRTRQARYDRLMAAQQEVSRALHAVCIGQTLRVLVTETLPDGRYLARSEADAPDVDGYVIVDSRGETLAPGQFRDVVVTRAEAYDLYAHAA